MSWRLAWVAAFAVLLLWITPPLGRCADEAPVAGSVPADKAARGDQVPARLRMEEVEIRGELERPEVFYIIPRRKADMDMGTLSKDYSAEIMEPMLPGPFEAAHSSKDQP